MAGETIRCEALCADIRPWSRTSHVVTWLTPAGCVTTLVKGAERPKSQFLGQYDLNYTCDLVYYARARGDVHAIREAMPLVRRDALRGNWRALAVADWMRHLVLTLAPTGAEAAAWHALLTESLDALTDAESPLLAQLVDFDLRALRLAGLAPDFRGAKGPHSEFLIEGGCFVETAIPGRTIPVSPETAACLLAPLAPRNENFLVDAARVISVFYSFHLDCAPDVRRSVLRMICNQPSTKESEK